MTGPYGPPDDQPQWGQPQFRPPGGVVPAIGYSVAPPQAPQGARENGAEEFTVPPKKKRSALPWVFGALAVVVLGAAVVLVLGFVAPGWFTRTVFDAAGVEKGIERTLTDSYHLDGVTGVSCPEDQPVEPGHRFDCRVTLESGEKTVTVTVKDSLGIYEVGYPK